MLYNYKFSLNQMAQLKDWKKKNNFNHILLKIEDIELSTYEVDCKIEYKKTIPLNMFEKYSIRLIQKADEIYAGIGIPKIASLLQLDEKLIKENLENLEAIDMLNGVNSDIITINYDENSIYLQYENKFKIESVEKKYQLTNFEYQEIENYLKKDFEQNQDNKDNKFQSFDILVEQESSKRVKLLSYDENQFLLYSKNGINSQNDLKFINSDTFNIDHSNMKVPENVFCHYDEFLPLLRDKLSTNKTDIVIIGSKNIKKENLEVLKAQKNIDDVFILSNSDIKNKRIFTLEIDDFVLIGNTIYLKKDDFVVQSNEKKKIKDIKEQLVKYFKLKIIDIEPDYDFDKIKDIDNSIEKYQYKIEQFNYKNVKEYDKKIKELNTQKNKLYGLTDKNAQTRNKKRKDIDRFEELNNQNGLEKYPTYLQNRDDIFDLKDKVTNLENQKNELQYILSEIQQLEKEKKELISADNRDKIKTIENEIEKLERIKI